VDIAMLWSCILLPQLPPEGQQAALEALCLWALQWSSEVSARAAGADPGDPCAALWLELGASERLLGAPVPLLDAMRSGLAALGHACRLGLAPTPRAAALLARSGCIALTPPALRARLASLPLAQLALPPEQLAVLRSTGLTTIGELLALPDDAIARRLGPDSARYLQRLTGRLAEPLAMYSAPARFAVRCELPGPVHDTTALLFPLQRLLAALQGYLRGLDRAIQRCTLRLEHHRREPTCVTIGMAAPGREAAQLLVLVRERFTRLVLPAPVLGIVLEAPELLEPLVVQLDGFSSAAQEAGALQQLIARLGARLGEQQVRRLDTQPDHRPERAWCGQPAHEAAHAGGETNGDTNGDAPRPCWLLPEPRSIAAPGELLAGPERIEGGWWEGADIARDYYLARGREGERLWVYRELRGGGWHVHGYWA
jgi:protein ImuB